MDTFYARGLFLVANRGQQANPTKVADSRWAHKLNARELKTDKYLNIRHEPVLVIRQGTLLAQAIDWGNTFFSDSALKLGSSLSSRQDYVALEQHSLVAYAQVGNSLIKHSGDSTALLKRARQVRVFYFHSLWP
ncbi:MAG: hypothetical protein ACRYFK_13260 [Janthinobacterium lividum]